MYHLIGKRIKNSEIAQQVNLSSKEKDNEVRSIFIWDWAAASAQLINLYLKSDFDVNKIFLPDRYFNMTSDGDLLRDCRKIRFDKPKSSLDIQDF